MLCICSFICYILFCPYLKEFFSPRTGNCVRGKHYSKIQRRELSKHYANYFNLTNEAKHSLAASLGITYKSLSQCMLRKWNKENRLQLETTKLQPPTLHKQGHGIDAAGTGRSILLVVVILTQLT